MLEQAGEPSFVFRESDDAVTDVAGRQHVELFPQAPAGTAVVTDRYHRAQFADLSRPGLFLGAGTRGVALKTFEKSGQAGAAANGDDVESTGRRGFASRPAPRTSLRICYCHG